MTKTETTMMPVKNPFNDSTEDLIAEFELHFSKGKLQQACLSSLMSKADIELMSWLKTERLEEIEAEYMEAYCG